MAAKRKFGSNTVAIVQEPYVDDPIVQETLKLVTSDSFLLS